MENKHHRLSHDPESMPARNDVEVFAYLHLFGLRSYAINGLSQCPEKEPCVNTR